MLKLLVCFSFLIITFVAANYDFHDPDFNQLLFEDLTTEIEDKPLRLRRSTDDHDSKFHRKNLKKEEKEKKKEKDSHCCSGEQGNPEVREAAKEMKKQCTAEIRAQSRSDDDNPNSTYDPLNCEGIQAMREKTVCAVECIAKKLDVLDDNGAFKRDALLNHTLKLIGESRWNATLLETYINECLASLTKNLKDEKEKNDKPSCNPHPLEYHYCTWKKLVEGCPAESQVDNKKCRKTRERFAKGDTSFIEKDFKKLFKRT